MCSLKNKQIHYLKIDLSFVFVFFAESIVVLNISVSAATASIAVDIALLMSHTVTYGILKVNYNIKRGLYHVYVDKKRKKLSSTTGFWRLGPSAELSTATFLPVLCLQSLIFHHINEVCRGDLLHPVTYCWWCNKVINYFTENGKPVSCKLVNSFYLYIACMPYIIESLKRIINNLRSFNRSHLLKFFTRFTMRKIRFKL